MQVLTAGPLLLSSGGSDTVAFALIAGSDYSDFSTGGAAASAVYDSVIANCCEGLRGNVYDDWNTEGITVGDIVYLVDFLWRAGPAPTCWKEGNVDGSSDLSINVGDVVFMVRWLWQAGVPGPHCKDYQ